MTELPVDTQSFDLSTDPRINKLLNDVVGQLKEYIETQTKNLNELTKIGVALSATRNLDQLLEMIVDNARAFTNSDGGTLYLVNEDETALNFTIVQTESINFRMGGVTGGPVTLPDVALKIDGEPNNANVCSYVANSGELVNIADVYEVEGFNFDKTRIIDELNNYRSQSMLVVPMRDHELEIIGVLQLINSQDPVSGETIPFANEYVELTEALASQAAVAITNTRLIHDLQNLFESFIITIATAIDEKSHCTGGHIERVANLTMDIAKRVNDSTEGPYADVRFTDDEMVELRLAAWLHDTGKITTPEFIVEKRTKLETIFDRKELVRLRFELAMTNARLKLAETKAKLTQANQNGDAIRKITEDYESEFGKLKEDLEFVLNSNAPSEFVPDEKIERLNTIATGEIETSSGSEPMLTENELYNLSIRKGNLTNEEREVMDNHVTVTIKLLEKLPFPKKMRNVPFYAGAHHEKLNGKGYPLGLKADKIPLQARIMALADIFEALTAKDRPYKKPMNLPQALKILGFIVKDGELDPELVKFFIDENMPHEYAQQYMDKEQLDIE